MKKTAVVLLLTGAFLLSLFYKKETYAEEKGICSHGNFIFGENLGFYGQDFTYLYSEIDALKAECN